MRISTYSFAAMVGVLAIWSWSCRSDLPTSPPAVQWSVKGKVEDYLGVHLAGADLKFYNDKDSSGAVSDSSGRFEVQLLQGRYYLRAHKSGFLTYCDTLDVMKPGLELRVRLGIDPAQDYLPLAIGNWWEYGDNTSSFYSGIGFNSWGTERWEIVSASADSNGITCVVRVEAKGKSTRTYPVPPEPRDTTEYAKTSQFEFIESGGWVSLEETCTRMKHFMQPDDKFPSPNPNSCDSSRCSRGAAMIINGKEIETLQITTKGMPYGEDTWVAFQIGIVAREVNLLSYGNSHYSKRLKLRQYFVQNAAHDRHFRGIGEIGGSRATERLP